jgi:low temperature requirement protein LtrA
VVNLLLPVVFSRRLQSIPLNFPHLVERFTLFVIITFGEMVVGIAQYFTVGELSASTILVFIVAVSLFVYYILQLDYMMNLAEPEQGTWIFQYAHLPIFFGLGMTTVSFAYLLDPEANSLFVVLFLYTGLLSFYLGVFATHGYNLPQYKASAGILIVQVVVLAASFVLSLVFMNWHPAVILITAIGTTTLSLMLFHFYKSRRV